MAKQGSAVYAVVLVCVVSSVLFLSLSFYTHDTGKMNCETIESRGLALIWCKLAQNGNILSDFRFEAIFARLAQYNNFRQRNRNCDEIIKLNR